MAENRTISFDPALASVGETVAAVRLVAATAERALREQGFTEVDGAVQDVMAARLIAEESLDMEAAGDPLAKPMAEEALRMANESLKAVRPSEPDVARGEDAARVSAPKHAATPTPEPTPTPASEPAPAPSSETGPAPRAALAGLPVVEAAPAAAPTPVPEPAAAPAPLPDPEPVGRHDRGFAIPYGPSEPEPERLFPMPDEPAAAAPEPIAPTGAPRRPKAAKIACAALAVVLLALAGLVGAAWWGLINLPDPVQERILLLPDAHAKEGRLNAAETEVPPGSYQMVLNQVAAMSEGSRTLRIAFENPAANDYAARLVLSCDGAVVAETGMVQPGRYVETVELDRALPAGEHHLSAAVLVYSGATQVNTMSADVSVRVK